MDFLGWGHLLTAVVGLVAGALVLATRKGTKRHRQMGWLYTISMLLLNGTAFLIYDLFGRFGPFHFAAMFSLGSVLIGINAAVRRKPPGRWIANHAYWMTGSYVGLVAAAVSEISTRYLDFDFGLTVALASAVVMVVGVVLILARVPVILRDFNQ